MKRLHLQLDDEYAERAEKVAATEHRSTGNWLAKVVIEAVDAQRKRAKK